MLVLENDEYWALYGTISGGVNFISGFIQGQGISNNGTFTSSNALDFGSSPPLAGTLSATYVPGTSIAGSLAFANRTVSFSATPPSAPSTYVYNTPAMAADIAGAWSLTSSSGVTAPATITAAGEFSALSAGCSITGSIVPRATGKNVYNVVLMSGPAPCGLPNATFGGIAISTLVNGGPTRQLLVVANASRSSGLILSGTR
jgi:hypothetical protein